jgi:molecular chaperone DnaK (HSP70)
MSPSTARTDDVNDQHGIWIGIDLGTTNSCVAVWDSARGSPKWIRLPKTIAFPERTNKMGRIMPSVVRIVATHRQEQQEQKKTLVGAEALTATTSASSSSSLLQSVKRLFGKRYQDLDQAWIKTLDYDILPDENVNNVTSDSIRLIARMGSLSSSSSPSVVELTPQDVLSIELNALRTGSQEYLSRYLNKKKMKVPGVRCNSSSSSSESNTANTNATVNVRNVVVGIPAHFSQRHVRLLEEACRKAGFDGHVSTCLESTAAAMAYGLTMQDHTAAAATTTTTTLPTIMVVDMGGGTTDITIVHKQSDNDDQQQQQQDHEAEDTKKYSSYQVLVTEGDAQLGGDDIDEAIMQYCMKHAETSLQHDKKLNNWEIAMQQQSLRSNCREVKEKLCDINSPRSSETIMVVDQKIQITQPIFEQILQPWLCRAKELILKAKEDMETSSSAAASSSNYVINEVVLVGGTTRIPAIRRMIQDIFPSIELSTALNPMSSVAQGLAIQAAICSKLVPVHELKSALMLDCVPHAIGVLIEEGGRFVEIIPRNTPLPARGSASFTLADKYQAGITIHAVEQVSAHVYEPMSNEDFTFLLRRLTPDELRDMSERKIEVGMKVDTDGKFIVSVFDENDPEQVRKKARFEKIQNNQEVVGELGYIKELVLAESGVTTEQIFLVMTLLGLLVVYVAVKMAFTVPADMGGSILG